MRRALRRAGWALAAAGGIGMTAPALGQAPAVRILGPSGHVLPAGAEVVVMTEGQAREEEGQVELALMAEPMLFSYGLGAHVEGDILEVRGYVPTQAVREQALRVARDHTTLHVIDKLKIHATLTTHGAVDRPENIQRAARALLEDAFPEHGKGMTVKCDAHGHLTVSGVVGSPEDRVLVSRKMRQVAGCSCVDNQLSVAGTGHVILPRETADSVVFPDPVPARPALPKSEPSTAPVSAVPVASPAKKDSNPPSLGMPRVYSNAVPSALIPEPMPEPTHKVTAPPALDLPPPPIKPEPPRSAPVPSIDKDRPYGTGQSAAPALDLRPVGNTRPTPPVKLPEIVTQPAAPAVTPSLPAVGSAKPTAPVKAPVIVTIPSAPVLPPVKAPEMVTKPSAPALPPVTPDLRPMVNAKPTPPVKSPEIVTKPSAPALSPVKAPEMVTKPAAPAQPPVKAPEMVTKPAAAALPPVLPSLDLPPMGNARPTPPVKLPEIATKPSAPALPPAPPPKKPAVEKRDVAGSEESYVSEGTVTFSDDPPPAAKPVGSSAKPVSPAAPKPASSTAPKPTSSASPKPFEGTLTLTPPPLPPIKPATAPVTLSTPPAKVPAPPTPAAPPRPTVPAAVRLKERIQGVCGPAYEVKVTQVKPEGKNASPAVTCLRVDITGRSKADGERLMKQITPTLQMPEFSSLEINVDIVTDAK